MKLMMVTLLFLLALGGDVDDYENGTDDTRYLREEIYTGTVAHWLSSLCTGIMIE